MEQPRFGLHAGPDAGRARLATARAADENCVAKKKIRDSFGGCTQYALENPHNESTQGGLASTIRKRRCEGGKTRKGSTALF